MDCVFFGLIVMQEFSVVPCRWSTEHFNIPYLTGQHACSNADGHTFVMGFHHWITLFWHTGRMWTPFHTLVVSLPPTCHSFPKLSAHTHEGLAFPSQCAVWGLGGTVLLVSLFSCWKFSARVDFCLKLCSKPTKEWWSSSVIISCGRKSSHHQFYSI